MNRIPSTVLAGLLALAAVVPVTAGAPAAAAPARTAADAPAVTGRGQR
ncbi:hypothetical protein AB0K27_32905 [Micromonospora echinospora]